jgi:hypothetical protein
VTTSQLLLFWIAVEVITVVGFVVIDVVTLWQYTKKNDELNRLKQFISDEDKISHK